MAVPFFSLPIHRRLLISIADLWHSRDPRLWEHALEHYWDFVKPTHVELERSLDALDLNRLHDMDAQGWYDFLRKEYFCWKYTAPNRYKTTTRQLQRYADESSLDELHQIKERLLALNPADTRRGLETGCEIRGLGTAGASGLLALMYPDAFGTVDQFVVKALRQVGGLPEAAILERMNPERLTPKAGAVLVSIMQRKASDNNLSFGTHVWTPRKVDKVLWTYGH